MMKNSRFLFFSIFFYLTRNSSLELSWKNTKIISFQNINEKNEENEKKRTRMREMDIIPEIDGDTCVIFSAIEGDPQNCWCPRGYIMCSEEDVLDLQTKLSKIKDKNERSKVTPSWIKRLCDNSKEIGFKSMSVVIDYELAVICKDEHDNKNADFEIIGASGYITNEHVIEEMKKDLTYVPRKCTVNNFYLCRKVENDNVNCQYGPWSNWSACDGKKQRRTRKVLRSNQNNDNFCLWNGKKIPRNIIEETRTCMQK
ncbi:secreted protein with altered thrombospondin repeat domain, putative [Plasmodium malariae]|uniref:Secreted protein with altered thrombospondin repeat domain, putative n=2 Tax=Plasmodium malariae TaxID=5858 RepID=A0A1D3JJ93_PLAMA|nr:secreted protein with altered thrombospondin repeat domain, putative [Plasmodium malariae]SBT86502.1 secreted protein with altered thrombospondin repeat domain, putative [Plasmodium malariae]